MARARADANKDSAVRTTVGARRTEKLSEVLAREIVRDLRDLPPATMLPSEAVMLQKYGVGRASLREALRLLEVQGLVVIRPGPGGGPMVAQVDSVYYARVSSLYYHMSGATYHDVVDARITIEPVIARLVAERQDPDDIAALESFLASHADGAATTGGDYQVEDASGFHSLLAGMTGNPVLALTARSLQEVLLDRARGLFPAAEQEQIERAHAAIARAIIKGEGAKAERLMRAHMQHQYIDVAKARHPAVYDETVDWK